MYICTLTFMQMCTCIQHMHTYLDIYDDYSYSYAIHSGGGGGNDDDGNGDDDETS